MSASASKKKRKELEEQGLSPKAIAAKKDKEKKQKLLRNILIVVLCVAVAAAAVFAVISLVNRPSYDTSAALATVGDEKITVPVYDIFYNSNASSLYNYGYSYFIQAGTPVSKQNNPFGEGTLEEFFKDNAATAIQTAYNYYILAKEDAGFELTKEQKDAIDTEIDAIKSAAETYGFPNVNSFLSRYYGEGCKLKDYETYLTVNAYSNAYYAKLQEEFAPSAEELKAAYDKDPNAFDQVNYTYAAVNAESKSVPVADSEAAEGDEDSENPTTAPTTTVFTDDAKAEAKEKAEGYKTEMPEDANTVSNNKANAAAALNQEIADWLFDAARKEGDVEVFSMNEEGTSYRTVRFNSRDNNDYFPVNANVITITKDKEGTELKEGEQSAKDKFDALVKAVQDGMTDEAFSEAVTALGQTASTSSITHNYSVEEIRTWLYDASRKAGDLLTTYESDTAYYLVRYVSTDEVSYRDTLVKNSLWEEKTNSLGSAKEIVFVEDMMQYANTDLTFNSNTSGS